MPRSNPSQKGPLKKAAPVAAKKTTPTKAPAKKAPAKKATSQTLVKPDPAVKKAVRRPVKKKTEPEVELVARTQVHIGKRTYALPHFPGCPICLHPKRALVEEQILLGTEFTVIAKEYSDRRHVTVDGRPQIWPKITADQVTKHFKEDHSPIDAYAVRDMQEQLIDLGEYEKVGKRFITALSLGHRIIGRVDERVVRGELEPTIKDALGFGRLQTAVDLARAQVAAAETGDNQGWFYEQIINMFFDHVSKIVTSEQYAQLMGALRDDPEMRALYERRQEKSA